MKKVLLVNVFKDRSVGFYRQDLLLPRYYKPSQWQWERLLCLLNSDKTWRFRFFSNGGWQAYRYWLVKE